MAAGIDSYVQVAADGVGKKVDMTQTATPAGDTIYRQRAELVGDNAVAIQELLDINKSQLAVLRGILFALTNGDVTEDNFIT